MGDQSPRAGWWAAAWLLVGLALFLGANGRVIIPLAAWVAPAAWLVYLDRSTGRFPLVVLAVSSVVVQHIAWRGIIPAPGIFFVLVASLYGLVYFVPFAVHYWVSERLRAIPSTLVFPLSWISAEFLFQRWGTPYGSWFSLAYTQVDFLPLVQLASVAGTFGITFIVTWTGSVLAAGLRSDPRRWAEWRPALVWGLVLLLVITSGQTRLVLSRGGGETTRVAGLVPSEPLVDRLETVMRPLRGNRSMTAEKMAPVVTAADRLNDDLFRRTVREARGGARLVAWSETAGRVLQRDEEVFLGRGAEVADREGVALLLAYGVWAPGREPPFENKIVAIDADGNRIWEYHKAHPIYGAESPLIQAGDGRLRSMVTSEGRVSAAICHDLDFSDLLSQARTIDVGLVVAPSADWPAITPLHADMALYRAVESGFSLFRPTSGGRSLAVDSRGRTLARVDYPEDAVIAYVPIGRDPTVYGLVGDSFAWLCLLGLAGVIVASIRRKE